MIKIQQLPTRLILTAQYSGVCALCKMRIYVGEKANYDKQTQEAEHVICPSTRRAIERSKIR